MKTILLASLAVISLASLAPGREVRFEWDPVPNENLAGYELFTRTIGQQEWTSAGETAETTIVANAPDGAFETGVKSFALITGTDPAFVPQKVYSDMSETITVPAKPPTPQKLRLKITIQLETSENLSDWREVASISFPEPAGAKQFFRLK